MRKTKCKKCGRATWWIIVKTLEYFRPEKWVMVDLKLVDVYNETETGGTTTQKAYIPHFLTCKGNTNEHKKDTVHHD